MPDLRTRLHAALMGRYTIERELGRGGMATVFLAQDLRHDRPVALKVLHPEIAASLGTERFEREIRLAARLQHPHILSVHDSGEVPGRSGDPPLLWFTMPSVEGESLRDRLNRERQLPFADAIRIAREAADALDYAHHHGVIHRDIKPENILLSGTHALVADFGIARAWAGGGGDVDLPSSGQAVTGTGVAIGTPTYMSPEQATGERDIDARTDVYSLGCVLYEMLVGEPPFTGPTPQAIMTRRLTEEPRPARATRPAVPEPVEQALSRALARLPADRFGSAAEFARAFDVPDAYTTPTPLPTRPAAARRRVPLAVVLGLGILIGAGVLFAWRRHQSGSAGSNETSPFLAVLPFENLGDSADAYFADGMTDEVRGKLASVPGFRVIARGSVSQYRSRATPLRQIADDLGVRYLLTGTVRWVKAGRQNRVRVSPELVEIVRGGRSVSRWQQAFDADLTDVFQIQADIAGQVAAALNVQLAPSPALAEAPTRNLAAYDAFLRGEESYIRSSGPTALQQAIEHYERAVALDSSFARAWGRLSQAQSSSYFNTQANRAAAEAARAAAERALALAPNLPEAHLALGNYYSLVRLDYPRATEAFGSGLALAPEHPELLGGMGLAEQAMGRVEEALEHMRRGLAGDPRSLLFVRRLTRLLTLLRRYPEAEEMSRRALAIAPGDGAALTYAVMVHLGKGDLAATRAVLRNAPKDRDEAARITYIAMDWVAPWLFDDAQRELVLHAPLSFFGNDRGTRSLTLTRAYADRGDLARARVYADSARIEFERLLREVPEHPWTHALLGLSLAFLGRKAEAIREGELAVEMLEGDLFQGPYVRSHLVDTYLQLDEHEKALDLIDAMLRTPSFLSPARLRVDPTFDPLRQHPRFKRLVASP